MDADQTIAEIEQRKGMLAVVDNRLPKQDNLPLRIEGAIRQTLTPCFRLWQRHGICCQPDLSNLIGIKCQALIQHKERDGKTYANISAILKQARAGRVVR
jgi:hypothetical protein